MPKVRTPLHPGEIFGEEFMKPQNISQSELARPFAITHAVINEICRGKRGISAAMALKLARYFKMSPEFWLNLQMTWDLWTEWEKQTKKKLN
jgi:addiction module HigA family antidote